MKNCFFLVCLFLFFLLTTTAALAAPYWSENRFMLSAVATSSQGVTIEAFNFGTKQNVTYTVDPTSGIISAITTMALTALTSRAPVMLELESGTDTVTGIKVLR